MRRIDLLIGVVILAAILFSFVGVATYEAVPGSTEYDIVWANRSQDIAPKTDTQTGNGERTIEIPINVQNLTTVELTVVVSNPGPRASTITATVSVVPINASAPESRQLSLPQGPGAASPSANFPIRVQETPNATKASGDDENATLRSLASEHTSRAGMGTWRVKVQISGAQAAPVVGVGAPTFTITVSGKTSSYSATLQPATPDINR